MPDADESLPADLAALCTEFPAWRFGTVWASAASGPDARRLWASKGTVLLTNWDAAGLRASISAEEERGTPDMA
jgi:hypothetical protein